MAAHVSVDFKALRDLPKNAFVKHDKTHEYTYVLSLTEQPPQDGRWDPRSYVRWDGQTKGTATLHLSNVKPGMYSVTLLIESLYSRTTRLR